MRPCVALTDDAEILGDCDAGSELSRLIAFGADAGRALVFAGDAESIGVVLVSHPDPAADEARPSETGQLH